MKLFLTLSLLFSFSQSQAASLCAQYLSKEIFPSIFQVETSYRSEFETPQGRIQLNAGNGIFSWYEVDTIYITDRIGVPQAALQIPYQALNMSVFPGFRVRDRPVHLIVVVGEERLGVYQFDGTMVWDFRLSQLDGYETGFNIQTVEVEWEVIGVDQASKNVLKFTIWGKRDRKRVVYLYRNQLVTKIPKKLNP